MIVLVVVILTFVDAEQLSVTVLVVVILTFVYGEQLSGDSSGSDDTDLC